MTGRFVLQAIVSIMVIGATIGMIFTSTEVPQWWPPLAVAVVGYLFGTTNGSLRPGGGGQ
jgi:hypothetical protein